MVFSSSIAAAATAQRCLACATCSSFISSSASQVLGRRISSTSNLNSEQSSQYHFSPSPFTKRRSTINISDKFVVHRELKEGDNAYGVRRYLLFPRIDSVGGYSDELPPLNTLIASLNANKNMLFGAKLHRQLIPSEDEQLEYQSEYLAACGPLLDLAKEDGSMNGQQIQALATLSGLCSWVSGCLEKDGEGSDVLMNLMRPTVDSSSRDLSKTKSAKQINSKRANQKINQGNLFLLNSESERIELLGAITAIATGIPRQGHSVVGAGTYRDGAPGWVALAREYTHLATNPDALALDASYVGRRGLEEVALYNSRDGEVTSVEHLAHTEPGYLKDAGGAMVRLFFV